MSRTATKRNRTRSQVPTHEAEFPFTRGARVGLFLLMMLTVTFAAGVLFVKFQLESFRAEVERGIETRLRREGFGLTHEPVGARKEE